MTQIIPGDYYYTRPGWDRPVPVTVEERGKQLFVRFYHDVTPVRWKDIPADAQFTKRGAKL